jgi:NCS1 family nucleobase:cation symporter-1
MSKIKCRDRRLYNKDLDPTDPKNKTWGWFEIFNVWANDVQSLFGYTLAASLFLTYGLNVWAVFLAILLAGFFIMWLVNLSGKPSVKLGIPYPVFARASMGVIGANFPAMVRGIVAMFWYGAQTYFASTAVALLLRALSGSNGGGDTFLGMDGIDWISFIFVAGFQVYLFWQGIDLIRKFLNFAGPAVYAVMIILMLVIWSKAGGNLLSEVGNIFSGVGDYSGGAFAAFIAIFGTMVAYFAAVVINFGDFSRFVKNEKEMKKGNLYGLPGNIFLFSFIALMVTAGTVSVFGETITNPTDMVERVGNLGLTVIAAFAFFAATIGINMVANFIPPAYDLANLMPSKINFRTGGLITSIVGFVIGAFWVSFISNVGMFPFVNTLGAILAPVYGIMIVDYYVIKKERIDINQLFSSKKGGKYYYNDGWNKKAFLAWGIAGVFSVLTVWHPALSGLGGFAWIIGAALGTVLHLMLSG